VTRGAELLPLCQHLSELFPFNVVSMVATTGLSTRASSMLPTTRRLARLRDMLRREEGAGEVAAAATTAAAAGGHYPRDMVGYGQHPPHARWPSGAHLAVQFVLNYEEGSERSVLHGDASSEYVLGEIAGAAPVVGARMPGIESIYEYGSRVGFWRLHELFTSRGVALTVFGVAQALERNPSAVSAMCQAGWEVASHGLRWIDHVHMSEAEERAQISEAVARHTAGAPRTHLPPPFPFPNLRSAPPPHHHPPPNPVLFPWCCTLRKEVAHSALTRGALDVLHPSGGGAATGMVHGQELGEHRPAGGGGGGVRVPRRLVLR
jgi:hypothetical protein